MPKYKNIDFTIFDKITKESREIHVVARTNKTSGNFRLVLKNYGETQTILDDPLLTDIIFYDESHKLDDQIISCYVVKKTAIIDNIVLFAENKTRSNLGLIIPETWIKNNNETSFDLSYMPTYRYSDDDLVF